MHIERKQNENTQYPNQNRHGITRCLILRTPCRYRRHRHHRHTQQFLLQPFYYTIGDTLSQHGIDFIYTQTRNAFGKIDIINQKSGQKETIGSFNENFADTLDDVQAYIDYAEQGIPSVQTKSSTTSHKTEL